MQEKQLKYFLLENVRKRMFEEFLKPLKYRLRRKLFQIFVSSLRMMTEEILRKSTLKYSKCSPYYEQNMNMILIQLFKVIEDPRLGPVKRLN